MKDKLTLESIIKIAHQLNNEEDYEYFITHSLWKDGIPTCPCCKTSSTNHRKIYEKGVFRNRYCCKKCQTLFSVRTNTIFAIANKSFKDWIRAFISYVDGEGYLTLAKHINSSNAIAHKMLKSIAGIYETPDVKQELNGKITADMITKYLKQNISEEFLKQYVSDIKTYYHKKDDNYSIHILFPTTYSFTRVQNLMSLLNKHIMIVLENLGAAIIERLQTGRKNVRSNYDWMGKLPGDVIYTFFIGDFTTPIKITYK